MGGALPPSGHLRPGLCRPVPHGDPLCGPPGGQHLPHLLPLLPGQSPGGHPSRPAGPGRGRPAPPGVQDHGPGGQFRGRRRPGHVRLLLRGPHRPRRRVLLGLPSAVPLPDGAGTPAGHLLSGDPAPPAPDPAPDPAPVRHGVGHGRLLPAGCLHPCSQRTARLPARGARHPPVSPGEGA